ncbi:MAG TPA: TerC family protein [Urbifossiella sp.]
MKTLEHRPVHLAVIAAFLLVGTVQSVRGEAEPAAPVPPAAELQRVRIEPGHLEGTLQLPAISLRTEMDVRQIDLKNISRITFQRDPKDGHASDSIQLVNREIVRGRVVQDAFPVQLDDGQTKSFAAKELSEIRVLRERHASLFTVLLGLFTLTAMEIVLGIDNVIFLAIVAGTLPAPQQPKARRLGLAAALGTRLLLLFTLSFLLGLTAPVFTLPELPFLHDLEAREVSWRDIILLVGGAFLIGKSVLEMHEKLEHAKAAEAAGGVAPPVRVRSFARVIATIAVIDIVFSLDSVITAVGMVDADQLWVMVTAMILAMLVMLWFSGPIGRFVDKHPTVKVLALAFLILIGVMLVAEGLGLHINKGYIYFAMAFGVGVEMVNMKLRRRSSAKAANADSGPAAAPSSGA